MRTFYYLVAREGKSRKGERWEWAVLNLLVIFSTIRNTCTQLMTPWVRPPGPRNRGIIGNFPLGSSDPLGLYTQWARQYGDIFYYRAFFRPIYFLNHPDFIEHVWLGGLRLGGLRK